MFFEQYFDFAILVVFVVKRNKPCSLKNMNMIWQTVFHKRIHIINRSIMDSFLLHWVRYILKDFVYLCQFTQCDDRASFYSMTVHGQRDPFYFSPIMLFAILNVTHGFYPDVHSFYICQSLKDNFTFRKQKKEKKTPIMSAFNKEWFILYFKNHYLCLT